MFLRKDTVPIQVGNKVLGGGHPILVQSMTNTDTRNVAATVAQIHALTEAGCDIVRVAVPDMAAAEAVKDIRSQITIPLVTDIHFDYRLALRCIENGADKVRVNPGNIGDRQRTEEVVRLARAHHVPIRIGVNGGSLEKDLLHKYGGATAQAIVESALSHIEILEALDFTDIVVSLKSSDIEKTVAAYTLMAERRPYPLHVGLTEAGTVWSGTIKSCAAIGAILSRGIGDTIRVSLTGDPVEEVRVAKELLAGMNLGGRMIQFISCPTCGRTRIDLIGLAGDIERQLRAHEAQGHIHKPLTVAVMGCAVNGPGEASAADIGLAGGDGEVLLFEKGKIMGKMPSFGAADAFVARVLALAGES